MDINSRDPSQNIIPFRIKGVDVGRFDTSGNLGIGTITPSATLEVVGTVKINGNAAITGSINMSNNATSGLNSIDAGFTLNGFPIESKTTVVVNMDSQAVAATTLNRQKKQSIPLAVSSTLATSDIVAKMSGVSVGKTQTYGVGPAQMASYGNIVVAVGEGTNSIAYSLVNPPTASSWIGIPNSSNTFTTRGWNIAYANGTWVAVGEGTNSIAYSTMTPPVASSWVGIPTGSSFNGVTNTFNTRARDIAYGNGVWVVCGDGPNTSGTNTIAYSLANPPTAESWVGIPNSTGSNFGSAGFGITFGNGTWVATGQGTNAFAYSTRTPPTFDSWITVPLNNTNDAGRQNVFNTNSFNVIYANGVWLAAGNGDNTLCYSVENPPIAGSWMPITRTALFGGVTCWSVAYGNGTWVASAASTTIFAYSTARIPHSSSWVVMRGPTPSSSGEQINHITFNAATNTWYFMGDIGTNCMFYSTQTPPVPASWVGIQRSAGIFNTQAYGAVGITTSAFTSPINVARLDNKVTFPANRMLAVGGGGADVLARSANTPTPATTGTISYSDDDGVTWQMVPGGATNAMFSSQADIVAGTSFGVGGSRGANAVAWNGEKWVAAGNGRTNSLAFSDDGGMTWTGITGKSIFSVEARDVAWNGRMWVAVGRGVIFSTAYSYDGVTWMGPVDASGTPVNVFSFDIAGPTAATSDISGGGIHVIWTGKMWVATGTRTLITGSSPAAYYTIAYSMDGKSWIGVPESGATNTGFDMYAHGVAWNGRNYVATGRGTANTLAFSTDVTSWQGMGNTVFSVWGRGITWGAKRWMATGRGTNTVAYSTNGRNWQGCGANVFKPMRRFMAMGDTGLYTTVSSGQPQRGVAITYSDDGVTWDSPVVNQAVELNGDIPLYRFSTHTFTNAGKTGQIGPNLTDVRSAYSSSSWSSVYVNMNTTGYQLWTVPSSGFYTILLAGAKGNDTGLTTGGSGAIISMVVTLFKGQQIGIIVGQVGIGATSPSGNAGSAGGGGSFVWNANNGNLIAAAGGGGGAAHWSGNNWNGGNAVISISNVNTTGGSSNGGQAITGGTNGSGGNVTAGSWSYGGGSGGGWFSAGTSQFTGTGSNTNLGGGTFSNGFLGGNHGYGGDSYWGSVGGFGGGGGGNQVCGGGGGGYSGGGAAQTSSSSTIAGGGGGSSFFSGSSQTNVGFNSSGNGYVTITLIGSSGGIPSTLFTNQFLLLTNAISDNASQHTALMYSTDAGASWARVPGTSDTEANGGTGMTISNSSALTLSTNTSRTRFLVGGGESASATRKVYFSNDGFNWRNGISSPNATQMAFVYASLWVGGGYNRWLVGGNDATTNGNGRIMYSGDADAVAAWLAASPATYTNTIISCFAANANFSVILAGTLSGNVIYRSENGGATWTTVNISTTPTGSVNSIAFSLSLGRWVAVGGGSGAANTIIYSTDATGNTWIAPATQAKAAATAIFKIGSEVTRVIWDAVGGRFLIGGWNGESVATLTNVAGLNSTNNNTGCTMAYSSDGIIWTPVTVRSDNTIFSGMTSASSTFGPFLTQCREIMALDMSGDFTPINTGYSVSWNSYANRFIATGNGTTPVVYSSDGGVTWIPANQQPQQQAVAVAGGLGTAASTSSSSASHITYTIDGKTWSQGIGVKEIFGTGTVLALRYGQTSSAISPNGRIWVAGGFSTSGTSCLAFSQNGVRWTAIAGGNTMITNVRTIAYAPAEQMIAVPGVNNNVNNALTTATSGVGNGVWVAGGDTTNSLVFSYDGISWSEVPNSLTILSQCNACTFGNGLFVAGGNASSSNPIDSTANMAYSTDGINWQPIRGSRTRISNNASISCITYGRDENGRGLWVAGVTGSLAASVSILYSYNGIDWIAVPGSGNLVINVTGIAYGQSTSTGQGLWIASVRNAGYSFVFSTNGRDGWTSVSNTKSGLFEVSGTGANSITYFNGVWYATGASAGINATNPPGRTLAYSYEGTSGWFGVYPTSNLYGSAITTFSLTDMRCVATTAEYSIPCGSSAGLTTSTGTAASSGIPSSLVPVRSVGWTAGIGSAYLQHPTLLFGADSSRTATTSTVISADGGRSWGSSTVTLSRSAFRGGICNDAFWNGTIWAAVGFDAVTGSKVATSRDGVSWTQIPAGNVPITGILYSIMWNGTVWMVGGDGSPTDDAFTASIAWSTDLITWNAVTNTDTKLTITKRIAWNGMYWVAVGEGDVSKIMHSRDTRGLIWEDTFLSSSTTNKTASIISVVNDVVWGGGRWVAVGRGNSISNRNGVSILYSVDTPVSGGTPAEYAITGRRWTGVAGSAQLFPYGANSISWNGKRFVATGPASGTCSTGNIIAWSADGISWNAYSTTKTVAPGQRWVAVGSGSRASIALSADGSVWTDVSGSALLFSDISGASAALVNTMKTGGRAIGWNGNSLVVGGARSATTVTATSQFTATSSIGRTTIPVCAFIGSGNGVMGGGTSNVPMDATAANFIRASSSVFITHLDVNMRENSAPWSNFWLNTYTDLSGTQLFQVTPEAQTFSSALKWNGWSWVANFGLTTNNPITGEQYGSIWYCTDPLARVGWSVASNYATPRILIGHGGYAALEWNGVAWLACGYDPNNNNLIYTTDKYGAIGWTAITGLVSGTGSSSFQPVCIASSSRFWVVGGSQGSTSAMYYTSDRTGATGWRAIVASVLPGIRITSIGYNGSAWICCGGGGGGSGAPASSISWRADADDIGTGWAAATISGTSGGFPPVLSGSSAVAYNAGATSPIWIVVGDVTSNTIDQVAFTSTVNGSTEWKKPSGSFNLTNTTFGRLNGIAWTGYSWIATSGAGSSRIANTTDITSNVSQWNSTGIFSPTLCTNAVAYANIPISLLTTGMPTSAGIGAGTGAMWRGGVGRTQGLLPAGGTETTSVVLRSENGAEGTRWSQVYSRNFLIAVGGGIIRDSSNDGGANRMAYSYDGGLTWITNNTLALTNRSNFGPGSIRTVKYGNGMWVAGGDSTNTPAGSNSLAWSRDGINWTGAGGTQIFGTDGSCYAVCCNDSGRWVAVGGAQLTTSGTYTNTSGAIYTMAWSNDGMNWTPILGSRALFGIVCQGVTYGADASGVGMWVAIGRGTTYTGCAYSYDGKNWYLSQTSGSLFGTSVNVLTERYAPAPSAPWFSVCMSSNGQYQYAATQSGLVWRSIDYGVTWSAAALPSRSWVSVAISSTGQYVIAACNDGSPDRLFNSSDFGVTWISRSVASNWRQVAISASGQYQVGVSTGSNLLMSRDYGVNWFGTSNPGSTDWTCIAISSSGQYITAAGNGLSPFVSTDFGATWTSRSSSWNWSSLAMNPTGQIQIGSSNTNNIYISTDYGVNWNVLSNAPSGARYRSLAISSTGAYISGVFESSSDTIKRQTTLGGSFTSVGVSANYFSICMSTSGQYQTAVANNGLIFISSNFGETWSAAANDSRSLGITYGKDSTGTGMWIATAGRRDRDVATTSANTMAYSYDGKLWRGITAAAGLSEQAWSVAYGKDGFGVGMWVAAGYDTVCGLKWSYDGITWNASTGASGASVWVSATAGRRAITVYWNGTMWLASTSDIRNGEPRGTGIAANNASGVPGYLLYSYNGKNWLPVLAPNTYAATISSTAQPSIYSVLPNPVILDFGSFYDDQAQRGATIANTTARTVGPAISSVPIENINTIVPYGKGTLTTGQVPFLLGGDSGLIDVLQPDSATVSIINETNWYSLMTAGDSAGSLSGSGTLVQSTLITGGEFQVGRWSYNSVPISTHSTLTFTGEILWTPASGYNAGDYYTVTFGASSSNIFEGITVMFMFWNGYTNNGFAGTGIYLLKNGVAIAKSNTLPNGPGSSQWFPISIIYTKSTLNTWQVNINNISGLTYSDPNALAWSTSAGNWFIFLASSGAGLRMSVFIRKLYLAANTGYLSTRPITSELASTTSSLSTSTDGGITWRAVPNSTRIMTKVNKILCDESTQQIVAVGTGNYSVATSTPARAGNADGWTGVFGSRMTDTRAGMFERFGTGASWFSGAKMWIASGRAQSRRGSSLAVSVNGTVWQDAKIVTQTTAVAAGASSGGGIVSRTTSSVATPVVGMNSIDSTPNTSGDIADILYPFTTHTFTNAGVTGRTGPTLSSVRSAYSSASWAQNNSFLSMTGDNGIQIWTVPTTGLYSIICAGAAGGAIQRTSSRGRGIIIRSVIQLNKGTRLFILVGQLAAIYTDTNATGGGGGTFVAQGTTLGDTTPIIVAGGGGGAGNGDNAKDAVSTSVGQNGDSNSRAHPGIGQGGADARDAGQGAGGAGGFYSNGESGSSYGSQFGYGFRQGGAGGISSNGDRIGGFGGGAGTHSNNTSGGAGGGYSGGSAPYHGGSYAGGSGSSFSLSTITVDGYNTGHGYVAITLLGALSFTSSSTTPLYYSLPTVGGVVPYSSLAVSTSVVPYTASTTPLLTYTDSATAFSTQVSSVAVNSQYNRAVVGGSSVQFVAGGRGANGGLAYSNGGQNWIAASTSTSAVFQTPTNVTIRTGSGGFDASFGTVALTRRLSTPTTYPSGTFYAVAINESGQYQSAAMYGGQIWTSSDYGVNWTARADTRNWQKIAMSSSGQYQTAVIENGNIWTSFDYGITWTSRDSSRNWFCISISSTGQYQTAHAGFVIYTSSDYGINWVSRGDNREWFSVSISSTGQYQTAVVNGGQIWGSSDYGVSWSARESSRSWRTIAISSTGQYQTATVNNGFIYISSNFGITWTSRMTDVGRSWIFGGLSMSSTGQYQNAIVSNASTNGGGFIYTSSDFGITWFARMTDTNRSWGNISMSGTGQYQTASVFSGTNLNNIYTSSNYGISWVQRTTARRTNAFTRIKSSASGQYQIATSGPVGNPFGQIYISSDYGQMWMPRRGLGSWLNGNVSGSGAVMVAAVSQQITLPDAIYIRTGGSLWRQYIPLLPANSSDNLQTWGPDGQFNDVNSGGSNQIAMQFSYFAGYWLNVNRAVVGQSFSVTTFAANGNLGTFTFTATSSNPVSTYTGSLTGFNSVTYTLTPQLDGIAEGLSANNVSVPLRLNNPLSYSPILYLDAANSSSYNGSTWTNLGSLGGNVNMTSMGSFDSGDNGGSFNFNGSSNFGTLSVASQTLTQTTYVAIAKTNGKGSWAEILDLGNDNIFIGTQGTDLLWAYPFANSLYVLTPGVWYTLAFTISTSGSLIFYVNGTSVFSTTISPISRSGSLFGIGAGVNSTTSADEHWNGKIASLAVYNRALSAQEMAILTAPRISIPDFWATYGSMTSATSFTLNNFTLYASVGTYGNEGLSNMLISGNTVAGFLDNKVTIGLTGPVSFRIDSIIWDIRGDPGSRKARNYRIYGSNTSYVGIISSTIVASNAVLLASGTFSSGTSSNTVTISSPSFYNSYYFDILDNHGDPSIKVTGITINSGGPSNTAVFNVINSRQSNLFSLVRSTDYGMTFNDISGTTLTHPAYWRAISTTNSGLVQTAVAYGGSIYRSSDTGATWSNTGITIDGSTIGNTSVRNWQDIAISAETGVVQVTCVSGGYLYVSSNTGETWDSSGIIIDGSGSQLVNRSWQAVAVSANGQFGLACVNSLTETGFLYRSVNFGVAWSSSDISINGVGTQTTNRLWQDVGMSANGKYQVAAASITGMLSTAPIFNGSTNRINFGNQLAWNSILTNITVECWFRTSDTNNQNTYSTLVSRWVNASTSDSQFRISMDSGSNGRIVFHVISNTSNNGLSVTSPLPYNDTSWYHVAGTYSSSTGIISLYVNGILVNSSTNASLGQLAVNNTPLMVGSDNRDLTDRYFRGSISEVRIWNVVRSPSQIANSFQSRLVGNESGLAAYFRLDQSTATGFPSTVTGFRDSSPNSNNSTSVSFSPLTWFISSEILFSKNFGASWTSLTTAGLRAWSSVTLSENGNTISATTNDTGGAIWTYTMPDDQYYRPAILDNSGSMTTPATVRAVAYGNSGTGAALDGYWLAGADASANSLAYSTNGIDWTAVVGSKTTLFNSVNSVAYGVDTSGTPMWVAVGLPFVGSVFGVTAYSIAYSYNMTTWIGILNNANFTGQGNHVAYGRDEFGAGMWVAVGQGDGALSSNLGDSTLYNSNGNTNTTIFYSYDGANWAAATGTGTFSVSGTDVTWGVDASGVATWVATGIGYTDPFTGIFTPGGQVAHSTNGRVWAPIRAPTAITPTLSAITLPATTRGSAMIAPPARTGFTTPTYNNIWRMLGGDIDGEAADDYSGYSVSMSADGMIVAIGATSNDGAASNAGHVRVYSYNPNKTVAQMNQNLPGFGPVGWDRLGADIDGEAANDQSLFNRNSVVLSSDGTTVAIGANTNDGNGNNSGHVRVYRYTPSKTVAVTNQTDASFGPIGWTRLGADIDGEAANDESGWSVGLSADGNIVAIGAWSNDGNGTDSGHVRVYRYTPSKTVAVTNQTDASFGPIGWNRLGADIDGEAIDDRSGTGVAVSADGTTVAIGAHFNDGTSARTDEYRGKVRVYKYNATKTTAQMNQTLPNFGPIGWNRLGDDIDGDEYLYENYGPITTPTYNVLNFPLLNTIPNWEIDISFTSTNRNNDWRGLVGSMRNAVDTSRGWGIWVSSSNGIHFSTVNNTYDSFNGSISLGIPYNLNVTKVGSSYNLRLLNLSTQAILTNSFSTSDILGAGPVSIGGWPGAPQETFGGTISYIRVLTFFQSQSGVCISLSSDGSIVAIGANGNDGNGTDSGHVRVYRYNPSKVITNSTGPVGWERLGGDIDGEASSDQSGLSVSLSADGTVVAIGSQLNDNLTGSDRGHVRVYRYNPIKTVAIQNQGLPNFGPVGWERIGVDIDGEAPSDYSGYSVSLSADGTTLGIGAIYNDGGGNNAGHVRVYKLDTFGAITYRSSNPSVAEIYGNAILFIKEGASGTTTITATQAASPPFTASPVTVQGTLDVSGTTYTLQYNTIMSTFTPFTGTGASALTVAYGRAGSQGTGAPVWIVGGSGGNVFARSSRPSAITANTWTVDASNAVSVPFPVCNSIIYSNGVWVAGNNTDATNILARSVNGGVTWTPVTASSMSSILTGAAAVGANTFCNYSLAYADYSNDTNLRSWIAVQGTKNFMFEGGVSAVATVTPNINASSYGSTGTRAWWVAGGVGLDGAASLGYTTDPNGAIGWTRATSAGITNLASINSVAFSPFTQQWVAVGAGATGSLGINILISDVSGITWTATSVATAATPVITLNTCIWNQLPTPATVSASGRWLVGGTRNSGGVNNVTVQNSASLYMSTDTSGATSPWTPITGTGAILSQVYSVAYNGRVWIAAGVPATDGGSTSTLMRTTDPSGATGWVGITATNTSVGGFDTAARSITWNADDQMWIATGENTATTGSGGAVDASFSSVIYSLDVSGGAGTWRSVRESNSICFSGEGTGVAFTGDRWFASGEGNKQIISTTGTNVATASWSTVSHSTTLTRASDITYTGRRLIATGSGAGSTNGIILSTDNTGASWSAGPSIGFNDAAGGGTSVNFEASYEGVGRIVATGRSATTNTLSVSTDGGSTWSAPSVQYSSTNTFDTVTQPLFTTGGNSVAYVGNDTLFAVGGNDVHWTGKRWVATGRNSAATIDTVPVSVTSASVPATAPVDIINNNTTPVATSEDGITWQCVSVSQTPNLSEGTFIATNSRIGSTPLIDSKIIITDGGDTEPNMDYGGMTCGIGGNGTGVASIDIIAELTPSSLAASSTGAVGVIGAAGNGGTNSVGNAPIASFDTTAFTITTRPTPI